MITFKTLGIEIILFLIFAAIIGGALYAFNQASWIDANIKKYTNIGVGVLLFIGLLLFLLNLLQGGNFLI